MEPTLEERYGQVDGSFIRGYLTAWYQAEEDKGEDFDCADNHRTCQVGNLEEMALYEQQEQAGCCGKVDIEFGPSPTGKMYRYGFNYGH
jgi:hypothetical protein